ncbi:MAG: DUF1801 domain-containing protein [Polaribacter sp.]|nr:DUF1801 domain-containing protein [Polaribacter sp.]
MDAVSNYIEKKIQWKLELEKLRKAVQICDLEETIKWGAPVYTNKGKNIVGLFAFKNYVGLWFFQGARLKDSQNVLINAQEGKTAAMRQWRFFSIHEIDINFIRSYIVEAIENQEKGNIIKPQKHTKPLVIHELFQQELDKDNKLLEQFEEFNLTRKREFTEYIAGAKREDTKLKRVQKIIPMILEGTGLYDKYKKG